MAFLSNNGIYNVVLYPDDKRESIKKYVNKVEVFFSKLKEILCPLEPLPKQFKVVFDNKSFWYDGKFYTVRNDNAKLYVDDLIFIRESLDFNQDSNLYGGLFHETIHVCLGCCKYRNGGENIFPEPFTVITQIAVLKNINEEASEKFANGEYGKMHDRDKPLFHLFTGAYEKEYDFEPFVSLFLKMKISNTPILNNNNFFDIMNDTFKNFGFNNLFKTSFPVYDESDK